VLIAFLAAYPASVILHFMPGSGQTWRRSRRMLFVCGALLVAILITVPVDVAYDLDHCYELGGPASCV